MANVPNRVVVFSSNHPVENKKSLGQLVNHFGRGVWRDFKTTNQSTAGKVTKFGASTLVVGSAFAKYYEVYTPLQWAVRGFGPLPVEFTKSGAIQVFEFTTVERALRVGSAWLAKLALVTVAWEGGILIGSVINQTLPESVQDAIGGTLNEVINEGGWRELRKHPFGIGM